MPRIRSQFALHLTTLQDAGATQLASALRSAHDATEEAALWAVHGSSIEVDNALTFLEGRIRLIRELYCVTLKPSTETT